MEKSYAGKSNFKIVAYVPRRLEKVQKAERTVRAAVA